MISVRVFFFHRLFLVLLLICTVMANALCSVAGEAFEVVEYRSPALQVESLRAVFTAEGRIELLLISTGKVRLLQTDPDSNASMLDGKGRPLLDDEFASVIIKGPVGGRSGITTYTSVTLYKKSQVPVVFTVSQSKRTPVMPGAVYSYGDDNAYGIIRLKKVSNTRYSFTSDITTGDPDNAACGADGDLLFKNGIAYMREQQIDGADDCQLLFCFDQKKLYIFMISDGYFCACAPGATMQGIYDQE